MEDNNHIPNEDKEGEKGEEVKNEALENPREEAREEGRSTVEENNVEEEEEEEEKEGDATLLLLKNGDKTASFIRYILSFYYDKDGELQRKFKEIDDKYLADNNYIGSSTFKLIIIYKEKDTNGVSILELFFDIHISDKDFNHEIMEGITNALLEYCEDKEPLFFIFSPSIDTLECYLSVLGCMDELKETYFIAASSPLSGMENEMKNEMKNTLIREAKEISTKYNLDDEVKYIELLDLDVEDSYSYSGNYFHNPTAVQIHLSNVDILVSKHIQSLNKDIFADETWTLKNEVSEVTEYYYNFNRIADEVNKNYSNDTPEIPMTRESLMNLIKSMFILWKEYDLTFIPKTDQHISALQSSLRNLTNMDEGEAVRISMNDVKIGKGENNAINNLYNSLRSILITTDVNSKIGQFFIDGSNPLILTASAYKLYKGEEQSLREFIEAYDKKYKENADKGLLWSRLYSIYSDRQWIDWDVQYAEGDKKSSALVGDVVDSATGGVVPSKKAIIISIILGAILIVVIVIVIIVTSRNEGFKPSMRQIKY